MSVQKMPLKKGEAKHAARLPSRAGIGLKPQHFRDVIESLPDVGFFEVHAENYMVPGGGYHHWLSRVRQEYPLSIHGVGLSIGGESSLDMEHVDRLGELLRRYEPESFSEHLAWSTHAGRFYNDLLPVRYDESTLARVCEHIDFLQTRLRRQILLENPSTYVTYEGVQLSEAQFISEVVSETGCGLLLDVANAYISCANHNRDAVSYLEHLPLEAVGEIHLAGFSRDADALEEPILIDDHGSSVDAAVWELYEWVIARLGPTPTLIEWDNDVPPLAGLVREASVAEKVLFSATRFDAYWAFR